MSFENGDKCPKCGALVMKCKDVAYLWCGAACGWRSENKQSKHEHLIFIFQKQELIPEFSHELINEIGKLVGENTGFNLLSVDYGKEDIIELNFRPKERCQHCGHQDPIAKEENGNNKQWVSEADSERSEQ